MDIGFILIYIILPIIMSFFIFNTNKIEKITLQNVLITKGVFYYLLAIATVINYFCLKKPLENLIVGFTVYISITEGSTAIKQAIDKRKNKG